jgi:S1/P1 Nuclease
MDLERRCVSWTNSRGCLCSVQKGVLSVKLAALAAALPLYSQSAFAWGGLGHEVICELAFRELDNTARQRVIALIQQDREFTTYRASCNWPDLSRQRAPEHFVNLPRDATGLDDDECPMAEQCVVSAIEHDFAVLASPDATDDEKLAALKFLGH